MVYEAEVNVEEDMARRERIQAGIQADSTIAAAEMLIDELRDSYTEVLAQEAYRAVLKVKESLASDRVDEITCRSRELRELLGVIHRKVPNGAKQRS
jgi:molecular chaperone DnaK (HSP70)